MNRIICCCVLSLLLVGCSSEDAGPPVSAPEGTVLDSQVDALRAAQEVGETIEDAFQKRDDELENQGG